MTWLRCEHHGRYNVDSYIPHKTQCPGCIEENRHALPPPEELMWPPEPGSELYKKRKMTETILVCQKCRRTQERDTALKAGWLERQQKDAPAGHLVIRCPEHITPYALRIVDLPQQRTSKRVEDNLDRGLWAEYGSGYSASVYESEDYDEDRYVISYHKDDMPPFNAEAFGTIEALILAMRKVEPKLSKWRLCEAG